MGFAALDFFLHKVRVFKKSGGLREPPLFIFGQNLKMSKSKKTTQVESGEGWLKIHSPQNLYSFSQIILPMILVAVLGFVENSIWWGLPLIAVFGFGFVWLSRFRYPRYEVLIDFSTREIRWSGAKIPSLGLLEKFVELQQLHFEQIQYLRLLDDYNGSKEVHNHPFIVLVLKNGKQVLLAYFENYWQRKKVVDALETNLQVLKK